MEYKVKFKPITLFMISLVIDSLLPSASQVSADQAWRIQILLVANLVLMLFALFLFIRSLYSGRSLSSPS